MTTPSEPTPSVQQQVQGDGNQAIGVNHGTAIGSVGQYVEQQTVQAPLRQLSLHQLPNDIADFTGRTKEIAMIAALLRPEVDRPAVVISAVAGMAGVGKSALAVHVAHQLAPQFADVQLYVDLRGTDERSLDPADVLLGWLRAFGIDEVQVPAELEQRSQMYRSCLAGKRLIVVLDNARDAAQVRPLLPGSSRECAVIVTGRRRLATLAGAEILDLEVMELGEALELLRKLAERQGSAEPEAAMRLAELCGRLPLALRIAGSLLRLKPHWTVAELVRKLADERRRLEQLQLEDLDIRASFNLSYGELGELEARLFRFLGLLPRDFGLGVAAAMVEWEEEATQESLERLIDAQLLEPFGVGRFVLHDLMRLVAREHLERREVGEMGAAEGRVVQWSWEQANFWNDALDPVRGRELAQVMNETVGETPELLETFLRQQSLDWFEAERLNLIDAMQQANRLQGWDKVVSFAANLAPFFALRSYWNDWVATHQLALIAADTANDLPGKAQTLCHLGMVYRMQGKWKEAIDSYEQDLQVCRELGDRHGAAPTLANLGNVYQSQGKWEEAIDSYEKSLQVFRELGGRHGEGQILNNLGVVYQSQGKWEEAIDSYQRSLQVCRELGDRHGEGQTLGNLGIVYQNQDKWQESIDSYQQSLQVKRELGDRHGKGQTLGNLGIVYQNQGKWQEAIDSYQQSLQVLRELGDRHGEGQTLLNLGLLHERQQPQQANAFWQEALTKLHPDSPGFQQLSDYLEQTQNSKLKTQLAPSASPESQPISDNPEQPQSSNPKAQNSLWHTLLGFGCLAFIGFNLLAGHWFLALAAGALGLGAWVWRKIKN